MTYAIPLIDGQDGFELVLDTIASILATETAAQQVLAEAAAEDPTLWAFRVYKERIDPWEAFSSDPTPIVNVWYDGSVYDEGKSNLSTRQQTGPSRYNVDIYAVGVSSASGGGHDSGDQVAAAAVHRIARLVRNILMHDKHLYLGLQGTVSRRWIREIIKFQPRSGGQPVQHVIACRVVLDVDHIEVIDQPDEETLDIINVKYYYEVDGQLIAELHYEEE